MDNNIYDLVDKFDFEKVRAYIISTNRKWINLDTGKMEIPTIEQMKATVDMLLRKAKTSNQDNIETGTGGFYVRKFKVVNCYYYTISFEISRSSNF